MQRPERWSHAFPSAGYPCGERKQIPLFSRWILLAGRPRWVPAGAIPFQLNGGIHE